MEARTAAAAKPREERVKAKPVAEAKATPSAKAAEGKSTTRTVPARPGMAPVDIATLEGSWLRKVVTVPGGMQVLMALVLTVVMTVMSAVTKAFPPEGAPDSAEATRTIFDVYGAGALMFLAPPVLIAGNAALYSLHAKRRRLWIFSAVAMAVFSLFGPQFLFPAGFLAYAILRAKKVEDGPSPADLRRAAKVQKKAQAKAQAGAETD